MSQGRHSAEYKGWRIEVHREGLRSGFVGRAEKAGRPVLATHRHTGKGAKVRALGDIVTLVMVELALEKEGTSP
jgi:hypothetical protein